MIDPYRSSDNRPQFYLDRSHVESGLVRQIQQQLDELDSFLRQFGYAVLLIERCNEEKRLAVQKREALPFDDESVRSGRFGRATWTMVEECAKQDAWMSIAARSGVISLHDFFMTMTSINANLKKSSVLSAIVDPPQLDKLVQEFAERFPSRVEMRNAVAHEINTTKKRDQHSVSRRPLTVPASAGTLISYSIGDDQDVVLKVDGPNTMRTWEGRVIEQGVTEETYNTMRDFQQRYYDAFKDVARKLRELRQPEPPL